MGKGGQILRGNIFWIMGCLFFQNIGLQSIIDKLSRIELKILRLGE